jgi:steroid delta-isomerase-like uncharacterized protein
VAKQPFRSRKEDFSMTNERNKAIPRRLFEAFETNDQSTLKEVLSPDLVAHHPGAPGPLSREELLQTISVFKTAFSDQEYTIEDQIAEGDKVVTRTTWRATHSGEFQGVPPTGKRVATDGIAITRIQDGQIVERWVSMDQIGLMQQLGLVPPPQSEG